MKRLVVCCDGTWNDADTQTIDTNVSLLARSVHGSQDTDALQIVLYLRGVGTSGLQLETWVEGATGLGIDDNILSGYMFIAQNYLPGDEIFLFGFSRGAFTRPLLVRAHQCLWRTEAPPEARRSRIGIEILQERRAALSR